MSEESQKMSAILTFPDKLLKTYINSIKVEGIIFIILGSLAILMPFLFARVLESFLGALFLLVGGLGLIRVIRTKIMPGTVFSGLLYSLFLITGIIIFIHPYAGVSALATIMGVIFFISGFLKIAFAFNIKPAKNWIWSFIDGIITFLLAVLIFIQWPVSGIVLISTMIGIKMLFLGYSMLMLSSGIKKATKFESSN